MAVQYDRLDEDIHAAEEEYHSSESEEETLPAQLAVGVQLGAGDQDGNQIIETASEAPVLGDIEFEAANRWPMRSGILHMCAGFILLALGLTEVVILPLALNTTGTNSTGTDRLIVANAANCYAIGIWTGSLMVLSGALGLRASLYKSILTVYVFYTVILLEVLLYTAAAFVFLLSYTSDKAYPVGSVFFYVHISLCAMVLLCYVFIIHAFTLYYDIICCGELQMCKRCIHCCFPCWCPRAVSQEALYEEAPRLPGERPPVLPV